MSRSEHYTCQIGRDHDGRIVSILVEAENLAGDTRVVQLEGQRAAHATAPLQEILRVAGLNGRQWTSPRPISLEPTLGAHAELLVRAIKPLRRIDRIANVADGIAGMSREEASYWHAQVQRRHGLKALRILLDGGVLR